MRTKEASGQTDCCEALLFLLLASEGLIQKHCAGDNTLLQPYKTQTGRKYLHSYLAAV